MTIQKFLLLSACALLGLLNLAFAAPETDWPKKPIVAILSFPAGGSTDIFARSVTAPLSEALGQSIVVENKPGAGGMIGLQAAAKAAPDGYTIHISALTNQSIASALFKNPPADLQKDFVPVALIGAVPHLIVVNAGIPAKNLPELIAFIKSKKGDFNYASQGNGSLSHLESTLFMQRIGATGTHIPYKGSSFALPDLIAGNTLMMLDSVTASCRRRGHWIRVFDCFGCYVRSNRRSLQTVESGFKQSLPPLASEKGLTFLFYSTIDGASLL